MVTQFLLIVFPQELLSINDASVATITYTLFMSTGSIEATRKYLETGNIPAGEKTSGCKTQKAYTLLAYTNLVTLVLQVIRLANGQCRSPER